MITALLSGYTFSPVYQLAILEFTEVTCSRDCIQVTNYNYKLVIDWHMYTHPHVSTQEIALIWSGLKTRAKRKTGFKVGLHLSRDKIGSRHRQSLELELTLEVQNRWAGGCCVPPPDDSRQFPVASQWIVSHTFKLSLQKQRMAARRCVCVCVCTSPLASLPSHLTYLSGKSPFTHWI